MDLGSRSFVTMRNRNHLGIEDRPLTRLVVAVERRLVRAAAGFGTAGVRLPAAAAGEGLFGASGQVGGAIAEVVPGDRLSTAERHRRGSADADDRVWGSRLTYPNLGEVRETGQQVCPGTHVVYVDSDSIGQRLASRPKPMLERG